MNPQEVVQTDPCTTSLYTTKSEAQTISHNIQYIKSELEALQDQGLQIPLDPIQVKAVRSYQW